MEITNTQDEFKIIFRSRINKRAYKTKNGVQYQYTATLPAPLTKLFNVEEMKKESMGGFITFEFYKWNYRIYIDSLKVVEDYSWENSFLYIPGVFSRAYKLKNGSYKIGLSRKFFDELDPHVESELIYIVHTNRRRFNNIMGLVEVKLCRV